MEIFLRDLEAKFDADRREEMESLVVELADAERAGVTLASRIAGAQNNEVNVVLRGGRIVKGVIVDSAATWFLIRERRGDVLVLVSALVAAWPLGAQSGCGEEVAHRIRVGHVFRELSMRGGEVVIDHDAGKHQGKIVGSYADHIDIETGNSSRAVDSRDRVGSTVVSLSLAGIRALDVVGDRW